VQLASARAALEASSNASAPVVVYDWAELRESTRNFNPVHAISRGTFGSLFAAELSHHEHPVAVKYLSPGLIDCGLPQLIQEISHWQHPNVTPILGFGIHGSEACVVYTLNDEGSLRDNLGGSQGPQALTPKQRLAVVTGVGAGLHFLHMQHPPMLHGGLKSSNILISASKTTGRVTDYALSRLCRRHFLGTLAKDHGSACYVDPQALTSGQLCPESDVFSFGVILLEVLLGTLPSYPLKTICDGLKDARSLMEAVDNSGGTWEASSAVLLHHLAMDCLHSDPTRRPNFEGIHAQLSHHVKQCETVPLELLLQDPPDSKMSNNSVQRRRMF